MNSPADDPLADLSEGQKVLLFAVMAVGQFMAILDIQIVAASINQIQAGLSASAEEVSWIQTAYLIAEIVMIPLSGYLSRALSTRWLFTVSCVLFTISSVMCAMAWNIQSMIVFRAIQGFVGGAMIPTVFATGYLLFRGPRQAMIPAVLGVIATLAPTIGPSLGGWITENYSWHWIFLINVVPGVIISIVVPILGRIDRSDLSLLRNFDLIGGILLALFLGCLEYALEEGPRAGWFEDQEILLASWVSVLSGLWFIFRSFGHPLPLVELRAFRDRNFTLSCFFNFCSGAGLFGSVFLIPLFLARVRGFNSEQIGATIFIPGLFMLAAAPAGMRLMKRVGPRILVTLGMGSFGLGIWWSAGLTSQWSFWELFGPQALRGVGAMWTIYGATNMALGNLPPEQVKNASSLFNLLRNLGGALGIAIANTILIDQAKRHYSVLSEYYTKANDVVQQTHDQFLALAMTYTSDADMAETSTLIRVANILHREATTLAFSDALYFLALLFAVGLCLVPLLKEPRLSSAPIEAH